MMVDGKDITGPLPKNEERDISDRTYVVVTTPLDHHIVQGIPAGGRFQCWLYGSDHFWVSGRGLLPKGVLEAWVKEGKVKRE